jgi:hypothetical protein
MAALTQDRNTLWRSDDYYTPPVEASTTLYNGGIVCCNPAGNAVPGSVSNNLKAMGIAEETVDNSKGAAGDQLVKIRRGGAHALHSLSGADEITKADVGRTCYVVDDQTVAKTDGGGSRSAAGIVRQVDNDGVWVAFV